MKVRWKEWRRVLWQTVTSFGKHRCLAESAGLSFYTLFSLAPVLIVTIAVGRAFFGAAAVRGQVVHQFTSVMGPAQAELVQRLLQRAMRDQKSGLAAVLGGLTMLFGATALFAQLQSSLNRVWEVAPKPGHLIQSLLKKRIASFSILLGIGFLLLVSLALSAAIAGFQEWIEMHYKVSAALLSSLNVGVSFLLSTVLFAMIYRILPDCEIAWRDVAPGSIAASIAFVGGKWLFGLYIGKTAVASPYGTAGALVVILLWVYYATSILLLGAEFTRAHSKMTPGSSRIRLVAR